MIRIHHLNCGTLCPFALDRLLELDEDDAALVSHCLLIETPAGLVLVDTGLGHDDVADPGRLAFSLRGLLGPRLREEETALAQVRALGVHPRDVRHIVVTHLDFEHAGGLADFPWAKVHVFAPELDAAESRRVKMGRRRYRPEQLAHHPLWVPYEGEGERWFGFPQVQRLRGLPPEILLVPLVGHTPGHCGVAVQDGGGWLLHAGDAYFFRGEVDVAQPTCPTGVALFERMMEVDHQARMENQERLRTLIAGHPEVKVFSAHDPFELQRFVRRAGREGLPSWARHLAATPARAGLRGLRPAHAPQ